MDFQRERKRERLHEPFPIKSQTFRKQLTWINRTKITPLKSLVHHSNEATVASSELSIFLPPSPPIRWIHEIFSIPKNSKRGEDLFRNSPSLSLSSNENHHRSLRPSNPLERQFRFVSRESRSSPLDRRRSKITAVLSRNPCPSLPLSLAHFHFSFPPVSWSNYLVSLVGISVLRHWSAGSGPAGRLFCKSNRSTRRALSGGPLSLSLILLSLPYLSLFLSFLPLLHPFLPCPLQRRCSSGAAAILFLKNDQQACTFVRSRRNPGSRLLSLSLSLSFSSSFPSSFFFSLSLFLRRLVALPRRVWWRHGQQRSWQPWGWKEKETGQHGWKERVRLSGTARDGESRGNSPFLLFFPSFRLSHLTSN